MSAVIDAVAPHVPDKETRKAIYRPVIDQLEAGDWDTQDECVGDDEAYDEIYAEKYPPDEDDE